MSQLAAGAPRGKACLPRPSDGAGLVAGCQGSSQSTLQRCNVEVTGGWGTEAHIPQQWSEPPCQLQLRIKHHGPLLLLGIHSQLRIKWDPKVAEVGHGPRRQSPALRAPACVTSVLAGPSFRQLALIRAPIPAPHHPCLMKGGRRTECQQHPDATATLTCLSLTYGGCNGKKPCDSHRSQPLGQVSNGPILSSGSCQRPRSRTTERQEMPSPCMDIYFTLLTDRHSIAPHGS